jgi:hypothetical protein
VRLLLVLCQVNDILAKYPDLEIKQLVHVEFAEAEGLQSYLLAYALHKIGYKSFHLILINVCEDVTKFFAKLEEEVQKLSKSFTVKAYTKGFEYYLNDIFSGDQPKANSFGECDISLGDVPTNYRLIKTGEIKNAHQTISSTQIVCSGKSLFICTPNIINYDDKDAILTIYLNRENAPSFTFFKEIDPAIKTQILQKYNYPIPPNTNEQFIRSFLKDVLTLLNQDLVFFVLDRSSAKEDLELLINYSSFNESPIIYTLNSNLIQMHKRQSIPLGLIDTSNISDDRLQLKPAKYFPPISYLQIIFSEKKWGGLPANLKSTFKLVGTANMFNGKQLCDFDSMRGIFYKLNQYMLIYNANLLINNQKPLQKIVLTNEIVDKLITAPLKQKLTQLQDSLATLKQKLSELVEKLKTLKQKIE